MRAFQFEKNFKRPAHDALLSRVVKEFKCPSDYRLNQPKHWIQRTQPSFTTAFTSYLGVNGLNQNRSDGVLYLDSKIKFKDIEDGLSHTLMVGERPPSWLLNSGRWYAGEGMNSNGVGDSHLGVQELNSYRRDHFYRLDCGNGPYEFGHVQLNNQCDLFHFWSLHQGGAHFLFADNSVRFLKDCARPVMPALASRAGGETIPDLD